MYYVQSCFPFWNTIQMCPMTHLAQAPVIKEFSLEALHGIHIYPFDFEADSWLSAVALPLASTLLSQVATA